MWYNLSQIFGNEHEVIYSWKKIVSLCLPMQSPQADLIAICRFNTYTCLERVDNTVEKGECLHLIVLSSANASIFYKGKFCLSVKSSRV